MHNNKILLIPILFFLTALTAIQAYSQEIPTKVSEDSAGTSRTIQNAPAESECAEMLDKTLDAFEKLRAAKADVDAELETNKFLREREEKFNAELLKAVDLLVLSEKRSKSFFRKLTDQLKVLLKAATSPENIAVIAGMILIIKNLQ